MLKRVVLLLTVMSLTVLAASPAFAQSADRIIDRTFDDRAGSPSRAQYNPPNNGGGQQGNLPPQARKALCKSIVRNTSVPRFVQVRIARQFDLNCRPAGSFLDRFF
jgi:hypothetical protein